MKKLCKNIDISDKELILRSIYACLNGKYLRKDVLELLSQYSKFTPSQIKTIINKRGFCIVIIDEILEVIAEELRKELKNRKLILKPIFYSKHIDPSSFKERDIGVENIKQQLYNQIAVEGLKPLLPRIGEYQMASIRGRGTFKGAKIIQKWLKNPDIKYGAKLDIEKCYESIDRKYLMNFLNKHIKNDLLLWLISTIINTYKKGLSIGSYLSQFLCNLYLSILYHQIQERMINESGNRLVNHTLFFMDDILILGTNKEDIHKAVQNIILFTKEKLNLKIKSTWTVFKIKDIDSKEDKGRFVDMMGFRIYRKHITIRKRIFKRIKKIYLKVLKKYKTRKNISIEQARRVVCYYGYLKHTNSLVFRRKYKCDHIFCICKMIISQYQKNINRKKMILQNV